jgi:hypothetical protein
MIYQTKSMTFNGHHPEEFGAVLSEIKSSVPAPRKITDSVPYRDGVYDFSRFDGSLHYDDRTINCYFNIVASDMDEANDKLSKTLEWLNSDGDGLLYDERDSFWHYKEVSCTSIETAYYLSDKTAIQVSATFSAYPYKVSNSGITVEALTIKPPNNSASYHLIYKPSNSVPGLYVASGYESQNFTDSIVTQISITAKTVMIQLKSGLFTQKTLVRISDYFSNDSAKTRVVQNVYFQFDGDIYAAELYDSQEFSFFISPYSGTTRVIFQLREEISADDVSKLWYKASRTTKGSTIGFEDVPLTIKSSALPTITIYQGTDPTLSSAVTTYTPGTEYFDISDGIYRIVVDNAKGKELTFIYDSVKRRL